MSGVPSDDNSSDTHSGGASRRAAESPPPRLPSPAAVSSATRRRWAQVQPFSWGPAVAAAREPEAGIPDGVNETFIKADTCVE